jgi:hypothetical protein
VILTSELQYKIIKKWEDQINLKGEKFGFNSDYNLFLPFKNNSKEAILWNNHEYTNSLFVNGYLEPYKNKEDAYLALEQMGGSILHIQKNINGQWEHKLDSPYNKRLTGNTLIPFNQNIEVLGSSYSYGTVQNCAGGKTPWGNILSCEENYQNIFGERKFLEKKIKTNSYGVQQFFPERPPEHYGWVVEIEPLTGKAKKHVLLGRFAHEGATTIKSKNKVVVYMGDDKANEHIYKFVSESDQNFDAGTLYVANLKMKKWLPLDIKKDKRLRSTFKNQVEMLIHTRLASKLVEATPLDRPEDIEIHPVTKEVFVSLTKNKLRGNPYGSILKIKPENGDHTSLKFSYEFFLMGGPKTGFACPDNLLFDKSGNLYMATDISGGSIGKGKYKSFKNNGLFVIPTMGKNAGKPIQIASAPVDSEFTGPCFDEDESTMFLSVQHPGERTRDLKNPTSNWPYGNNETPRSAVIAITGF